MACSNEVVNMLACTLEQIAAPLLLPGMVDRVAGMLNFFLLKLHCPERKNLKLEQPENYKYDPKHLLKQIVKISVNLARWGDTHSQLHLPRMVARTMKHQLSFTELVRMRGLYGSLLSLDADSKLQLMRHWITKLLSDTSEEYQDSIQYTITERSSNLTLRGER